MDQKLFRVWLSSIDDLTSDQVDELSGTIAGGPEGQRSLSAIELAVGNERACPRCGVCGAKPNGHARGLQRYRCAACGRSFSAATGTPVSGLHLKNRLLVYFRCLSDGLSLRKTAARCGIDYTTAWRWRGRLMKMLPTGDSGLSGIVEADETFVRATRKGNRTPIKDRPLGRKRRGEPPSPPAPKKPRKAKSSEKSKFVPVMVAADRAGKTLCAIMREVTAEAAWAVLKHQIEPDSLLVTDGATIYPAVAHIFDLTHEGMNQSAGEHRRGELHINTVNSRHASLKEFLRRFRGVGAKHLETYLRWFHLIVLNKAATPRYCLTAAMGL